MHSIKQPALGIIATVVIAALSLSVISLFSAPVFGTWVIFLFMACIPTQIVCGLVWRCSYPAFTQSLSQPFKGLVFLGISLLGGAIAAPIMLYTVGGGVTPVPQLIMFTIFTIIVTFWLVGIWQTWPLSALSDNPLVIGLGVLLVTYLGGYILFNALFNFSFLAGAPIYIEALDPKGAFMAWQVLAFSVTTVAVIMCCILCDFWPLANLRAAQQSPLVFGILASLWVIIISGLLFYLCTTLLQLDYVVYMVRGPVSLMFGVFIILNLLQNSVFSGVTQQPARGLLLVILSAMLAIVLQSIYAFLGPWVSGPLTSGLPTYQLELWLANAMLAISFPLIVLWSDFLNLWPLQQAAGASEQATEPSTGEP